MPEMPMIRMDVKEGEKEYTMHAELPGVSKEDIHVTIEGNTVSVSAEVKKNTEQKEGDKVLRSERYFGKVNRSFTLGQEVDEAEARAKFDAGILELVLPKKAATMARKLQIE
jgi:HSP20 family protein